MLDIPQGTGKGRWRLGTLDGAPIVSLSCPSCGAFAPLSETHEILATGEVRPSVLCDCGFHEHVRLLGYWMAKRGGEEE